MKKSRKYLFGGIAIIALVVVGGVVRQHVVKNQEASLFNISKTIVAPDVAVVTSNACGSANGQTFSSTPATNLCSPGTASTPVATATGWTWTCSGNGAPVICAATNCPTGDTSIIGKELNGTTKTICVHVTKIKPPVTTCTPKIYVMSGHGTAGIYDDTYSFDGVNWAQSAPVPWVARSYAGSVFFQNKLWLLGGINNSGYLNDVWSFDGTTWTQHTNAPWSGRGRFGAIVFQNKLWVMGGRTNASGNSVNDVWSFDGTTWTSHGNAPWPVRNGFATVIDSGGNLLVMGGTRSSVNANSAFNTDLNDVWSFDGTTWTEVSPGSALDTNTGGWVTGGIWYPRFVFGSVNFNNILWVMGGDEGPVNDASPSTVGYGGGGIGYGYDVWSSPNGSTWTQQASAPWFVANPFNYGRGEFQLNVLDNKIWLMGGSYTPNSNTENFFNDVWSFDGTTWTQHTNAPWAARDGYASTVACLPSPTSGSLPDQGGNTSKNLINSPGNIPLNKSVDIDN